MEFDFEANVENSSLSWGEKKSLKGYVDSGPRDMTILKEHEPSSRIVYLKKEGNKYVSRFEGRPDHFAVVNSGNTAEMVEIEAWSQPLWSQEVKPGYALVEPLGEQIGLKLSTSIRSDWYPTTERYQLDITLTNKCQYVGALGAMAGLSIGTGFSTRAGGPVKMTIRQEDAVYVTSSSLLQVPLASLLRGGWKEDVVSAQVFESAVETGSTDPLGSCSEEVIERVHELYSGVDTQGVDVVAALWAIVFLKAIGAREFLMGRRGKGFLLRGLAFGILVASVTACTLNGECSPGMVCSFGECVPPLATGSLCEESADCASCPCIERNLPMLGTYFYCQCPDPSSTASQSVTPSRTPSKSGVSSSATRSVTPSRSPALPSRSPSMTKIPSFSSTSSVAVSPSSIPTPSSSMTTIPSQSLTPSRTPTSAPTVSGTPAATLAISASETAFPTMMITVSMSQTHLPLSSPSGTMSTNPTSASTPMTTATTSPTGHPTPSPTAILAVAINVDGHFEHKREVMSTSGASSLVPAGIFGLIVRATKAAVCIGTRLAKTMSETQVAGASHNSTSGNYTYDAVRYYGIEDPTMAGVICNDTYQVLPDIQVNEHQSRSLKSLELSSSPVFVYRDGTALTLRFIDEQVRIVEINIGGEFWNLVTNNSLLYVSLPVSTFWYTVTVVVRTRVNGVLESENAFTVQGERPCVIEDCYFCNLMNWDCTPELFKWLAIMALVLVAICILWVAAQFSATIFAILGLGTKCGLYCCKAVWNVTRKKGALLEGWVRANAANDISRAVVIMAMLSGALACDNSIVVGSEHMTTVQSQGFSTSTIVTDSIISIRGFGGVVCLLYQNEGVPIATLEIKSTSNAIECDLVNPYYTSAFEIYALSSFRCNGAGPCPDHCDEETPRDAYGEFNSTNWIGYPGETRCTRRCSGISCGCVLPASGCVYSTYSVLPKNPAARVSEVSSCTRNPSFYYALKDSQNQLVSSGEVDTVSEIGEDSDFTFEILTQTPIDTPIDFPTHLAQTEGTSSLVTASKRGRPAYGMVGDIQADSKALLGSGNFTYDPRIIARYDEKNKHDKIVSNPPGIFSLNSEKALPAVIGRSVWSTNTDSHTWATKIVSYDSGDSPSLIAVRSKGSFTVTSLVNVVCPVVEFMALTGCRECDGGALATFTVSSKCLPGSVLVQGKGAVLSHVYMDDTPREAKVVVRSDDEDYSEAWTFGEVEVKVEGHLELAIVLGQTELLYNGTEKEKAHEGFRRGSWSWWEYSLFGVACVAVIGVCLFIIAAFAYPSAKAAIFALKQGKKVASLMVEEKVVPRSKGPDAAEELRRRLIGSRY